MNPSIQAKLDNLVQRAEELNALLSDADTINDQNKFRQLSQEFAEISPVVSEYGDYRNSLKELLSLKNMLDDKDRDMREMAQEEMPRAQQLVEQHEQNLQKLLLPRDPNDNRNIYLEIRAGTGGEEAALFAADLLRMYQRYAETKSWKIEFLGLHELGGGGVKEVSFQLSGESIYGRLKYESGVHRVQRIPTTESSGRIHTSAATVAIMPEAEAVDVDVDQNDLRIDTYRASGAGGKHVNKTESAIRITHIPTGLVVTCQDEKSQHKNKEKALKVLRARLLQQKRERQASQRANMRKSLVSTGDRSAKIRTYNFPQGRVTDHRINLTLYRLEEIINGDLDEILEALETADMAAQLEDL